MPDSEPELNSLCDADPLARALAALRPASVEVDPTRVVFRAGQASRAAEATFWKRMFAAQCAVTSGLAAVLTAFLVLSTEPGERPVALPPMPGNPVATPEPAPPPRVAPQVYPSTPDPLAASTDESNTTELAEYLRVRQEVLTAGLGLLPESKARPLPSVSTAELERSLYLPPGILADHYPLARPRPKPPTDPEPIP